MCPPLQISSHDINLLESNASLKSKVKYAATQAAYSLLCLEGNACSTASICQ